MCILLCVRTFVFWCVVSIQRVLVLLLKSAGRHLSLLPCSRKEL